MGEVVERVVMNLVAVVEITQEVFEVLQIDIVLVEKL